MRVASVGLWLALHGCAGLEYDARNATFYRPPKGASTSAGRPASVRSRFDFMFACASPGVAIGAMADRARGSGFVVSRLNDTLHLSNASAVLLVAPLDGYLHVTCWADVRETCVTEYGRATAAD